MKYRVLRKFSSSRPHEIGEIVEFSTGHIQKLIEQRYLAPATEEDEVTESPAQAKAPGPVIR